MFKRSAAAMLLLCALLALPGCQPPQYVFLLNNSGRTIQVLRSVGQWQDHAGAVHSEIWETGWAWPFLIDDGAGKRMRNAFGDTWIVDLRAGRCRLRFETPMRLDFYEGEGWSRFPFYDRHMHLQLEADGMIYVVLSNAPENEGSHAVDVLPFIAIQPEGFPVAPTSRTCRA